MTSKELKSYHALMLELKWLISHEGDEEDIYTTRNRINEIEAFLSQIDDTLTRMVFRLKVVDGYSWVAVAMRVGGGNTADSVKQMYYRYLKEKETD